MSPLSILNFHRADSRMWGIDPQYGSVRSFTNQSIIGRDLYSRSPHAGAGASYHAPDRICLNASEVNEAIPHKPVLDTQPLLWGPYCRPGCHKGRSNSVSQTVFRVRFGERFAPSFLRSRTSAASITTTSSSPLDYLKVNGRSPHEPPPSYTESEGMSVAVTPLSVPRSGTAQVNAPGSRSVIPDLVDAEAL